jgi:hypothetical protein
VLERTLAQAQAHYRQAPADAKALLSCGQAPLPAESNLAEAAAYTVVAGMLLNLDEALTHE